MASKNVSTFRLSRKQAADYAGYSKCTFDKWASKGINLKFYVEEDGTSSYDIADIEAFEKDQQTF
ncbi:hypothetical protein Niako_3407 [Niastella koreensis GR20-10]|uniref:Uncharacterized protein n=2 Tax=Niastella koreensis TaxID=354356 RepID=G8TJH7_NIAKG|nr:hypothetical protein Niako_3407 [Niastella koreensis GR20-10]